MTETVTLSAERRQDGGKGSARKLRAGGRVPAVIYGHGRETESLSLQLAELDKVLQRIAGGSTIIDLNVEGTETRALIREVQRHPTRKTVTHVDFLEVHAEYARNLVVGFARIAGHSVGIVAIESSGRRGHRK